MDKKFKASVRELRKKLYQRVVVIVLAAGLSVFAIRELLRGKVGDAFVAFLIERFYLDEADAHTVFQYSIRDNLTVIIMAVVVLAIIILTRLLITWLIKYFAEISAQIDLIIEGSQEEIDMRPEMGFMETKLNQLNHTLRERERSAAEAEQRKNDLVMYLAHDIRTPLTSVIGYLSLMDEAPEMTTEQKAKYVHITLKKAYRLEKLINEFFEISRYNNHQIVLNKSRIDLYYMLVQMTEEFYPILVRDGKEALLHADENITVWGDADKLARVFNNLLKNAIIYSCPNSQIVITATQQNDMVSVSFVNQGEVIPPDKLAAIFEKFFRLDDARSTGTGGSGLGLAIAKDIVELHHGTITAASDPQGTSFVVTLPRDDSRPTTS